MKLWLELLEQQEVRTDKASLGVLWVLISFQSSTVNQYHKNLPPTYYQRSKNSIFYIANQKCSQIDQPGCAHVLGGELSGRRLSAWVCLIPLVKSDGSLLVIVSTIQTKCLRYLRWCPRDMIFLSNIANTVRSVLKDIFLENQWTDTQISSEKIISGKSITMDT